MGSTFGARVDSATIGRTCDTWVCGWYIQWEFRVRTTHYKHLPAISFDFDRDYLSIRSFDGDENTTNTRNWLPGLTFHTEHF